MNESALQVTSIFREADLPGCRRNRVHSSHSSFSRRSFFEPPGCRTSAISDRGYSFGSNEVETGKYSGSWLLKKLMVFTLNNLRLFPAFTPECFRELALGNRIQSQQRNCSRVSREFLAPPH
jgi:hypothetical protein